MIDSIRGKLIYKTPTYVRLDVNGMGYGLNIPLSTYKSLEGVGENTSLFTYLYVREDTMRLYGFKTEEEMETFKMLLSVTKVGPQLALGILSTFSPQQLRKAIVDSNLGELDGIPGVGKKTAQRIIIELKEKIKSGKVAEILEELTGEEVSMIEEGMGALISLGCNKTEARKVLKKAYEALKDKKITVEELIRYALREI